MRDFPHYYWDSCIWIDLIERGKNDRVDRAQYVFRLAQQRKVKLHISAVTLVEIRKNGSEHGDILQLDSGERVTFEDFVKKYVSILNVTDGVGYTARDMQKEYPSLAKAGLADSIHVAACVVYKVHTLHTFDERLLSMSNQFECWDGETLTICKPEEPDT